jgi:hypothetical protein
MEAAGCELNVRQQLHARANHSVGFRGDASHAQMRGVNAFLEYVFHSHQSEIRPVENSLQPKSNTSVDPPLAFCCAAMLSATRSGLTLISRSHGISFAKQNCGSRVIPAYGSR